MSSHGMAPSAGSTQRQATGLGRFLRGAGATRGTSLPAGGSGAPSRSRLTLLALAALALCALVAMTASVASGAVSTEYVKSFGPDGTEGTDFDQIRSVAVDEQNGNVYVLDGAFGNPDTLYKFAADGTPLDWGGTAPYIDGNKITGLNPDFVAQVAVDSASHVIYVTEENSLRAFEQDGEAAEFAAGPSPGSSEILGFSNPRGVAVDVNGSIYVSNYAGDSSTVSVFASTGEPLTSFEPGDSENIAIASDGTLYVVNPEPFEAGVYEFIPNEFPATSATEYTAGKKYFQVPGISTVGVDVDSITGDLYVLTTKPSVSKYDSSGAFVGDFGKAGEAGELPYYSRGLAVVPDGEELQFYVGANDEGADTSKVAIFGEVIEPGPPSVLSTSAADVAATSATLRAELNPNTFATTYRFEYGLGDCEVSACTSVPLGGAPIGSGHHPVKVSQDVVGLEPGTTYHYRIVAENSEGVTEGPDRTFTTQLSGLGFELPDRRAWEMVSPPNKHGGSLVLHPAGLQAARDGNGLLYSSFGSIEAHPDGNRSLEVSTALSRRGPEGWRSKDITLPHTEVTGLAIASEYMLLTPDLSRALVQARDDTPLSPAASERTFYLRENTDLPTYTPLLTAKEGFANVPPGTEFFSLSLEVTGANAGLADVVFSSPVVPLVAGVTGQALYRWSAGQVDVVSELPAGEGGGVVFGLLGSGDGSVRHAISADGSRIFWGAGGIYGNLDVGLSALYLRDTEAEESVRLDVPQPGASGAGEAHPAFHGASADGTVVFFTDSRDLTEDSSPAGRDLYRCEIPDGASAAGCATLTNLSALGSGESAMVKDMSPAFSEDGSTIYFVAEGVLDTEPNEEGDVAVAGEPNLYLSEEGEGVRFIATLSEGDGTNWGRRGTQGIGIAGQITAAASPSGRYFAFMSERSLTGYDNRDAASGEPTEQAFRYDAQSEEIACVSCNPTGASPQGQLMLDSQGQSRKVDRLGLWVGRWLTAALPEQSAEGPRRRVFHSPRSVLDNGRVFFNAVDALVPADSNGEWDVYQYESSGVGDCTATSGGASVSSSEGGCVSLLSSGTGSEEAAFMDASASGDDVFFLTTARLSVTDEDDDFDVYDARVDGVPAVLAPNTECLGEACQPAAVAPDDPTPASAGFRGEGNPKQNARKRCAKGKRLVRRKGKQRCVVRKHKRHGKASAKRRASR